MEVAISRKESTSSPVEGGNGLCNNSRPYILPGEETVIVVKEELLRGPAAAQTCRGRFKVSVEMLHSFWWQNKGHLSEGYLKTFKCGLTLQLMFLLNKIFIFALHLCLLFGVHS